MQTETEETLLDRLQDLLETQVERVKNGDFRTVEALAEQADTVVTELKILPSPQRLRWKKRYEHITQVYKKLELMIETEKDTINLQLRKVENGKKTVRAYHHKI